MRTYQAPCKINLSLKVLRKRNDGFHEVETVMVPLTLKDELGFVRNETGLVLHCDADGVPLDESNLVMKAARLMEEQVGYPLKWSIHLKKEVPHGAGLGGGSSDAATTLLALNELEDAGLSKQELIEMSAVLGSDVGFFIQGKPCVCSGRGEKVEVIKEWKDQDYTVLLLKPEFGVSTPQAYGAWEASKELEGIPYGEQRLEDWLLVNDLERPVFQKHLFLAEAKAWLLNQPETAAALMSGSGSTVFALCENQVVAESLRQKALLELDSTMWTWIGKIDAAR